MKRGDIALITSGPHKGSVGQIVFVDYNQNEATIAFDRLESFLKIPIAYVKPVM